MDLTYSDWICQPLLDIKVNLWYMTISLRKRSQQKRVAQQGLSLRTSLPWVRGERKRSSRRGSQRDGRKPRKCSVMETKGARETFKKLEVTCIAWHQHRSARASPQKRRGRRWRPLSINSLGTASQLIVIPPNCFRSGSYLCIISIGYC